MKRGHDGPTDVVLWPWPGREVPCFRSLGGRGDAHVCSAVALVSLRCSVSHSFILCTTVSSGCLLLVARLLSSILAWRIPWTEEPGRLQSEGSQRVKHDLAIKGQQFTKGLTRKMRVKYKFPLRSPLWKQGSWLLNCGS